MARQRMVTRTVKGTDVTVVCINTDTMETEEKTLVFGKVLKTPAECLKAATAAENSETIKVLKVKEFSHFSKVYALPESRFIAEATVIER